MDSIRQYFKRTDKIYLLLCIFSSVMAVLALSSWAAKQGNGFATDEVTGAIIGIGDYRRALVQAGAAVIGIVIALLLSCVDYRSLVKVWPVHVALTWGLVTTYITEPAARAVFSVAQYIGAMGFDASGVAAETAVSFAHVGVWEPISWLLILCIALLSSLVAMAYVA